VADLTTQDQEVEPREDFKLWEQELRQGKEGKNTKKIGFVEAFLMILIAVTADIIDIALKFIGLSDFGLMDIPLTAMFQLWFVLKGAKWAWELGGNLVEFIPYLDALPFRTAGIIIAIRITNNPKAQGAAKFLTGGFK